MRSIYRANKSKDKTEYLETFLDDFEILKLEIRLCAIPDNNEIERTIRPFVIGRKNWLFSNTPRGAHASAGMYSLVESAKANKIEPYHYLRYLFTNLPLASSRDDLRKLLPCNITEQRILSV